MSDDIGAYALEPRWVRRSFDRAAKTYAGAGPGHASRSLKLRYPKATVVALDSSQQMLKVAGKQQSWLRPFERVCADAQALPLRDGSVDLIVSNLMLQWCDPDAVFAAFRRVLGPRGLLSL